MYSYETVSCRSFPKYTPALRVENPYPNIVIITK